MLLYADDPHSSKVAVRAYEADREVRMALTHESVPKISTAA